VADAGHTYRNNIETKITLMEFEWDENKNKSNQEKHGIDFNDI